MSVKVNLLPQATQQRARHGQQRAVAVASFGLLVAALGAGYWYQLDRVADADAELLAANETVSLRESELADLAPFEDLEASLTRSTLALTTALGDEISIAGLMQDAALVTPGDVALTSLEFIATEDIPAADGQVVRPAVARLVVGGETTRDHAPGLERMLYEYDKISTLFNVHLATTAVDEEQPDILLFTIEADLGTDARTGRYTNGLPEGLR
jgi:hypothetical protein